ncbi:MAG TPA: CSLREA domain-containing protein [Myxococcaceae bacterium]|nr:CSLREA domain-containing protein [Myxococcaceae bacterium]
MVRLSYLGLAVLGLLFSARAGAASFVVNSANDVDDGACTTVHCSLREALRAANSNPGADNLSFNISPGGAQTIVPLSALPTITDSLNIDASTQPGYLGNPIISLRGAMAGAGVNGLVINAQLVSVKHLAIFEFGGDAITIVGPGNDTVTENYLGVTPSGAGVGNGLNGVRISDSPFNHLEANVICGNDQQGVLLTGAVAHNNVIVGNKIGIGPGGNPEGNTMNGVLVQGGASSNLIGDVPVNDGNTIAYNGLAGVAVTSGTRSSIRHDSIYSNAALGIDLGATGVTANDLNDPDSGANNLQNFPLVRNPRPNGGGSTLVDWRLQSTPFTTFTIELFSSPTCDPSGYGEGQRYLGSATGTTDVTGYTPVITSTVLLVTPGHFVTGTATDPNGNTSEFSQCVQSK